MLLWTYIYKYASVCSYTFGLGEIQKFEDQPIKTNQVFLFFFSTGLLVPMACI